MPAGPVVSAVRDVERELDSSYGSGLRFLDVQVCEAERPPWAALVRERICILQRSIRLYEEEKQVLLDKLTSLDPEADIVVSTRRRWPAGMLTPMQA